MKKLASLHPRIQKKIQVNGHSEIGSCWIWKGSTTAPRFKPVRSPADRIHRTSERAASYARSLPTVWSPEHGYAVPAHRRIFCDLGDVPYAEMPECRRCRDDDRCVNPHHLTIRGEHRQSLQPDLRHAIKARTSETRDAIWERLTKVQPMPGLSPQTMADECGLVEISIELVEEYERWYVANPHLIRDTDDDD